MLNERLLTKFLLKLENCGFVDCLLRNIYKIWNRGSFKLVWWIVCLICIGYIYLGYLRVTFVYLPTGHYNWLKSWPPDTL